jgi:hypothetical protein
VPVGKACLVLVSFNPAAPGPVSGQLQIKDDATSSMQTASLAGTGAKFAQAINFFDSTIRKPGLSPIHLTATSTSGLPVAYVLISGKAKLSGGTLEPQGPGPTVVRAVQMGNGRFSAAKPVDRIFQVLPQPSLESRTGGPVTP